jgi:ABC-type nitrate/sulfonate/bicarbonate transport system permease component
VRSERLLAVIRNAFPFLVVGAIWEIVARAGVFPRKLFPTLGDIARSFVDLTASGILPHHAIDTLLRLLAGFGLAAIVGVSIGVLMGRSRRAEDILLPLVSMGADDKRVFRYVIVPGALPYILTGLRLGLAQAWRILVAVEMLAAVPWGLGWLIFGAREFLNTDAMMAGIIVIAVIGLGLEKYVFQKIEDYTVVRWGMMGSMG